MPSAKLDAPPPDLRIVLTETLHPHEEHDSQRAMPLIERLAQESVVINPPIVSPMGSTQFVVLDGANRFYAFSHLHYPHILVQVVSYDSGYVELSTWRHVVCKWDEAAFLDHLSEILSVQISEGTHAGALAHLLLRSGRTVAVHTPVQNTSERNATLRQVVQVYQRNAALHRTALSEPEDIWLLHPDGVSIVEFPEYQPSDIIAAARHQAFIPPGISRHIIHGRALRLNYPLDRLRDMQTPLRDKNSRLQEWIQARMANRQARYYAEATYQFDE
jgi:hypothetical protein